jgi:hypothetical protein
MDFQGYKLNLVSFAVILSCAYWPYIYAPATSPRWAYLAVSLPILLWLFYKQVNFTWMHLVGLCFILWSLVSLVWSVNIWDGIDSFIKFVILAEAFVLGSYLIDLRCIFVGLATGLIVQSALLFVPLLFELDWHYTSLFVNPNIFSETALVVCVGVLIYEYWWLVIGLLPAIFVNNTRSVLFAGFLTFGAWLWTKSRLLFVGLLFVGLALCWLSVYLNWKIPSIDQRLTFWTELLSGVTLLGNGLGSFLSSYPLLSESMDTLLLKLRFAHNDLLQIVFELGVVGGLLIVIFCSLILRTDCKERYVLIAFIGVSCFSFPLYLPVTAFIAAVVCGHIAGKRSNICLSPFIGRIALRKRNEEFRKLPA